MVRMVIGDWGEDQMHALLRKKNRTGHQNPKYPSGSPNQDGVGAKGAQRWNKAERRGERRARRTAHQVERQETPRPPPALQQRAEEEEPDHVADEVKKIGVVELIGQKTPYLAAVDRLRHIEITPEHRSQ